MSDKTRQCMHAFINVYRHIYVGIINNHSHSLDNVLHLIVCFYKKLALKVR